jgi:hypothetical protein
MKKRYLKEDYEKRLNDSMRRKPFKTLHNLLCELHLDYNACLAGNLEGDPNELQKRFVRLCRANNLNFETEWEKMECQHDH